ncbi:shikimate kinase [Streptomyces sp. NPDC053755]|uniref:shikimate kinase n=1 Tax=Streptomyces sp. NPDC053755 TaxID=3155815 RepID=UPI0034463ECF
MTGPLVVLVGPMGSGKSTVGALLAERLGTAHRDTDDDIVAAQGRRISEIFATDGEARFRALEHRAVRAAMAEHDGVLSLGGGAVTDAATRALLAGRPVVHLALDAEEAVRRVGGGAGRPLLGGRGAPGGSGADDRADGGADGGADGEAEAAARWRTLMEARRPLYAQVARTVVDTSGRTPDEVATAVLHALELTPS